MKAVLSHRNHVFYVTNKNHKVTEKDVEYPPQERFEYTAKFKPGDVVFDSETQERAVILFTKVMSIEPTPQFLYIDNIHSFHEELNLTLV